MCIEINRFEYESLKLHKLVRLTAGVTCGWAGVDKTSRVGFCLGVEKA
jgi:hypothetical protein